MLYKLKVLIAKNNFIKKLFKGLLWRNKRVSTDIKQDLITKYVPNKTFIDVGCMWGVNGYFSFYAEEKGAKSVVAFDIFESTKEFDNIKNKKKSKIQFVQGDINSKECILKLGKFDVVYCTGLLYHVPDPVFTLSRLREICNDILILGTAVIPEVSGIDNVAVFYPHLNELQRKIWKTHQGSQLAITEAFDPTQGYGNWIWGFSSSCLESMLKSTGFDVVERHYGKFYSFVVCRKSTSPFLMVSGDWTMPDYSENVNRYKF